MRSLTNRRRSSVGMMLETSVDSPPRGLLAVARQGELRSAPEPIAERPKPVGLEAILLGTDVLPVHREIVLIALARGIKQDQLARMYNAADTENPKRFTGATIHEQLARTRNGLSQRSRTRYAKALGLRADHLDLADSARPLTDEQVRFWRTTLYVECERHAADFDAAEILANFEGLDASVQHRLLRAFALGVRRANLELVNALPEYGIYARARLPVRGLDHMLDVAMRAGYSLGSASPGRSRDDAFLSGLERELGRFFSAEHIGLILALVERLARSFGGELPLGHPANRTMPPAHRSAPAASGTIQTLTSDGRWWKSRSAATRADVMFGAASAFESGFLAGLDRALEAVIGTNETLSREQKATLGNAALALVRESSRPRFSDHTIGHYVERVSAYYADHPEAAGTEFGDVLKYVQDEPSESNDALAEWFVKYRKSD